MTSVETAIARERVLKTAGLSAPSGSRRRTEPQGQSIASVGAAGALWAVRQILRVARLAGAMQVVVGVLWWCANLGFVPAYGDTQEYLRMSQTLQVDSYRTLGYPLIVRASVRISRWAGLPYQLPLYLAQTALTVAVSWYLVSTFTWTRRARAVEATAFVATCPLVLHYSLSILSDAVASSMFVLCLAALGRVVVYGDRRKTTCGLAFVGAVGTALMRTEKCDVLLGFAGVLIVVALAARCFRKLALRVPSRRISVAALALLILPASLGLLVNRASQTADLGRPGGATPILMTRIVWPHLAEIREDLPERARTNISAVDAATFDQDGNDVFSMTKRMQALGGDGEAVTDSAIEAAIRCCTGAILAATSAEVVEYAFTPAWFELEVAGHVGAGLPATSPNVWDYTRMNGAHPTLTDVWLATSLLVMALIFGAWLVYLVASFRRALNHSWVVARKRLWLALLVWTGTVVNGCVFAAAGGLDANARYGVSNAIVLGCFLAVWGLRSRHATDVGRGRLMSSRAPMAPSARDCSR